MIVREAKEFWGELNMRDKIDSEVAELEKRFHANELPWNWGTVKSLIHPFPKTGQLDTVLPGQEDEATADPESRVPWQLEHEVKEEREAEEESGDEEEFDPRDWHEAHIPDAEANPEHSSGHALHGDGADGAALCGEQADAVIEQSARMGILHEAKKVIANLGGAVGASLINTVNRVIHWESKRFKELNNNDPEVLRCMQRVLDAEEEKMRRDRAELKETMQLQREKDRAKRELAEVTAQVKKARQLNREAAAAVAARENVKVYTLEMFGKGKKNAGGQQAHKVQMEAMERVRRVGTLSLQQTADWETFKKEWDKEMAESCPEDWPTMFAEIVQGVLNDLIHGKQDALSVFMYRETRRVLGETPALMIPGAPSSSSSSSAVVTKKK